MVLGLSFDQVWAPSYTSFHSSTQIKVSFHRDQLCVIQLLTVILSVSLLAEIVFINGHKKWIKAATNMKHVVNDSWFPITSVHINISKLRSVPKCPLFSNPLTYYEQVDGLNSQFSFLSVVLFLPNQRYICLLFSLVWLARFSTVDCFGSWLILKLSSKINVWCSVNLFRLRISVNFVSVKVHMINDSAWPMCSMEQKSKIITYIACYNK